MSSEQGAQDDDRTGDGPLDEPIDEAQEAAAHAPGRPLVDVSGALGLAGHEEELLGTADVPDTAPVQHHESDPDDPEHTEARIRDAMFTRPTGPIT